MTKKRSGFTLVELLIVIVVIGILSAMMMLASPEVIASAKVNNITSNLRMLKTAAIAYYTDNLDKFKDDYDNAIKNEKEIWNGIIAYLGTQGQYLPDSQDYYIRLGNGTNPITGKPVSTKTDYKAPGLWFVKYHINGSKEETNRIKRKLVGRTKSMGYLKATAATVPSVTGTNSLVYQDYDGTTDYVALRVF